MKKLIALSLALLLVLLAGCDAVPTQTTGADVTGEVGGSVPPETSAQPQDETTQAPESETEGETEQIPPTQSTDELRILYLDNDKNGVNDYRIEVNIAAASSTEKVPFRLPDAENPSEDSFRTVSLYDLRGSEPKLVWYSNLCMGSQPRGGVALGKDGNIFSYYFDVYEYGEGRKLSISCYEYVGDIYGNGTYLPSLKKGSYVTSEIPNDVWEDSFVERNWASILNGVNTVDEMLSEAEILLDVTGTEPIFSTDDNRFTKQYSDRFDYRELEACLDPEIQSSYTVPAE